MNMIGELSAEQKQVRSKLIADLKAGLSAHIGIDPEEVELAALRGYLMGALAQREKGMAGRPSHQVYTLMQETPESPSYTVTDFFGLFGSREEAESLRPLVQLALQANSEFTRHLPVALSVIRGDQANMMLEPGGEYDA